MTVHTLESQLWLPRGLSEVFAFFADASNLERITPRWLRFEVLTPPPIPMHTGSRIDYRLRVHGIPLRWQSEITTWEPPFLFTDEQLRGPYRLWKHDHIFHEKDGGTVCIDSIRYAVPGGALMDRLFVRRDLEKIFRFRRSELAKIFDSPSGAELALEPALSLADQPHLPPRRNHNLSARRELA